MMNIDLSHGLFIYQVYFVARAFSTDDSLFSLKRGFKSKKAMGKLQLAKDVSPINPIFLLWIWTAQVHGHL